MSWIKLLKYFNHVKLTNPRYHFHRYTFDRNLMAPVFQKDWLCKTEHMFYSRTDYFANVIMIEQNSVFKLIKGIWIKELKFSITTGRTLKIVHERNLWSWSTSPCWLSLQLHLAFSSKINIFPVIGNSSDRVYIT